MRQQMTSMWTDRISYVQMRMRFVVRVRMRQTKSVQVAIQNVSAHESDKICVSGKVVVFRICYRGMKHSAAVLPPIVQVETVVEEELLLILL